jgi:peptidoglycan/xylan/chitin deacetylase (PgdA/CDA1 family)
MYPKRVWAFSRLTPKVYLTFDDGPIPEVTPWVLDLLKEHNVKAIFFCIGDNIKKHPEIFKRILSEGHAIGNHTFHHINGWKTNTEDYLKDVASFEKEILTHLEQPLTNHVSPITTLFRPPYGKLTSKQSKRLQKKGYKIIMWDVLSYDFDSTVSEEKCLQNVLKNIEKGSIVVFHDSLKAEKKLRFVLPKVLEFIKEKGWNPVSI